MPKILEVKFLPFDPSLVLPAIPLRQPPTSEQKVHRHFRPGGFNLMWEAGAKFLSRGILPGIFVTWRWLPTLNGPHGSHPPPVERSQVTVVGFIFLLASLIFEDEVREE